jgi:hypothetical protein
MLFGMKGVLCAVGGRRDASGKVTGLTMELNPGGDPKTTSKKLTWLAQVGGWVGQRQAHHHIMHLLRLGVACCWYVVHWRRGVG